MKKIYNAPALECLAFCSATAIGNNEPEEIEAFGGSPVWNDGELTWT